MSRHIQQAMIDIINAKIRGNALAVGAINTNNPRLLFTEVAKSLYGIREKTNNNDGPIVELIQETIGDAENESWCMSFVQTCLAYVESVMGVTSPLFASEHCLTVWQNTPPEQRVKIKPLGGAIVIWQHGKTSDGHTGVVLDCDDKIFHTIEGNTTGGTDPNGAVVRDGGGTYFNARSLSGNGDMTVVGFLKPF